MSVYSLATILEVLCINTYTVYRCARKRKSKFVTFLSVCAVSAAVSAAVLPVVSLLTDSGSGSGLFMLFGFIYIVPLYFVFGQPVKHLIIVMSSSWIYTMFAYTFSFRIGSVLPSQDAGLSVLIVQTLFCALTLPYYIRLVNNIFVNILKNLDHKVTDSLLVISLSWFFIIFLANYNFAEGKSLLFELLLLSLIIVNAILSYKLSYKLVSVNSKAKELSQITRIDMLTQLKNREVLYEDVQRRITNQKDFSMIFVDLDNFKLINDRFGHAVGDTYLLEFVKAAKAILKNNDGFYRLHGDEFVFLIDSQALGDFCKVLEKLKFANNPHGLVFKGLSSGYSSYPSDSGDLSELLYLADQRMYQRKKEKHRV